MAKKQNDLYSMLRDSGLRKKVANAVGGSAHRTKTGKSPTAVTRTVESLRSAASELESRITESRRREAAKKAAQTRKRKASKRSAAAKKGARTRAKTRA